MTTQTHEQTLICCCPHCGANVEVDAGADGSLRTCAACGKPFRVEVPVAKACATPSPLVLPPGVAPPAPANPPTTSSAGTVPAPVQAAPPTPAQAASAAQAVAAAQAVQTPETPETPGVTIHLSMIRRYPFRCLGYLLLAAAGLALLIWSEMHQWHWIAPIGGVVLAAAILRLFVWWVRMRRTTLTLTNKRGVLTTGVFRRDSTEFDFAHMADFHIRQNALMRWLDAGDLAIVGSNGRQIVVMAVPHPSSVAAHMQVHVEAEKKAAEQPDMVVVQQPTAPSGAPAARA